MTLHLISCLTSGILGAILGGFGGYLICLRHFDSRLQRYPELGPLHANVRRNDNPPLREQSVRRYVAGRPAISFH
jgi:uncharacterized protein YneF (UPF0154 family)